MNTPAIQKRVYQALSGSAADRTGRLVSFGLIVLILLNVLAVMVESMSSFQHRYGDWLAGFEIFSVSVFVLEYLLRLWACSSEPRFSSPILGRLRFSISPLAVIDLLAVLPALIMWTGVDLRFLRVLRLTRMLRVAKLGRYSTALHLMGQVARQKREELLLSLMLMLLLLVLSSSLMYLAEHDRQPEAFSSIPAAMWWGVMTLTTVGYGDVYPVTIPGKVLGALIAVMGIGLFALPAGILGSGFVGMRTERKDAMPPTHCPHCGKPLG